MQIHVLRDFAGKLTRERRIQPGIYESGDERLFGVEDYLVQNGFAQWVNAPAEDLVDRIANETGAEMVSFGVPVEEVVEPESSEQSEPTESFTVDFKGRKVKGRKNRE